MASIDHRKVSGVTPSFWITKCRDMFGTANNIKRDYGKLEDLTSSKRRSTWWKLLSVERFSYIVCHGIDSVKSDSKKTKIKRRVKWGKDQPFTIHGRP